MDTTSARSTTSRECSAAGTPRTPLLADARSNALRGAGGDAVLGTVTPSSHRAVAPSRGRQHADLLTAAECQGVVDHSEDVVLRAEAEQVAGLGKVVLVVR